MLTSGMDDRSRRASKTMCGVFEANAPKAAPARASRSTSPARKSVTSDQRASPISPIMRARSMLLTTIGG